MPNWIQVVLLGLKLQILISQKVMIVTQLKTKKKQKKKLYLSPYINTSVKSTNRALAQGKLRVHSVKQVTNL